MGWPEGRTPVPTDTAFATEGSASSGSLEERPDLKASAAGVRAADARVQQAGRARLPKLEGFARLETHAPDAFSGAEEDWTVGFQVRVPVFTGFKVDGMQRAAAAMRDAARTEHAQRLREARAQVAEARRAVEAARQGSEAAQAAANAAEEAARLMRRRFDEGLVTTADLLGVEAQAAGLRTQAVNARLGLHMALARLAFLTDTDTTTEDIPGGSNR
jgi:outer membrane protein TolC